MRWWPAWELTALLGPLAGLIGEETEVKRGEGTRERREGKGEGCEKVYERVKEGKGGKKKRTADEKEGEGKGTGLAS